MGDFSLENYMYYKTNSATYFTSVEIINKECVLFITCLHLLFYFLLHVCSMDLIHYSFAPLILFRVPYTLDLLPYYLSITNGAGGVGIF